LSFIEGAKIKTFKIIIKIVFLLSVSFCFIKILNPLTLGGNEVKPPLFDDGFTATKNVIEYTHAWDALRDYGLHRALDIVATKGTAVYPVANGKVLFTRYVPKGTTTGGGNAVVIDHGNGNISIYCHLATINPNLKPGDIVTRGETENSSTQIGTVGDSGHADGVHLHLQFRTILNPEKPPSSYKESADARHGFTSPQRYGNPDDEGFRHKAKGDGAGEGGDGKDGDGGPGGENPDDNESSANNIASYSISSDPEAIFFRIVPKKGKKYILQLWNLEQLQKERDQYFSSLSAGGTVDEAYLTNLNTKIDESYNLISTNSLQYEKERAETPDVVVLRHGYFSSASSLIDKSLEPWRRVILSFSPLDVNENPVMVIPTGGLYGMENSEQFKSVLRDYVGQGGTLIVFSQQHGYEFSALPTPDGKPLGGYGWREDQSCQSNSVYVDTWHPVLSSTTQSLISSPVDGFFTDYPSNSTVLLRRRVNAMPAMLAYPYGEGMVIVTSLFEDWGSTHWQSTAQGRAIIRDLITWAKNIGLQIPEYNLRKNPTPEVSLNLEVKNLSEKAASKARILWLDPGRNLFFEEEKLISIPAGEGIVIPVDHAFSNITDDKLGIWHADYILYDSEGKEIQPEAETDSGRFNISLNYISLCLKL
jgi:hypothetical protein